MFSQQWWLLTVWAINLHLINMNAGKYISYLLHVIVSHLGWTHMMGNLFLSCSWWQIRQMSSVKVQVVAMLWSVIKQTRRFSYIHLAAIVFHRYNMLGPSKGHSRDKIRKGLRKRVTHVWSNLLPFVSLPLWRWTPWCIAFYLHGEFHCLLMWMIPHNSSAVKLSFISHIAALYTLSIIAMTWMLFGWLIYDNTHR